MVLKCGVGSKPCGKRCIPEEHKCRLNEAEVSIEKGKRLKSGKNSKLLALGIATAGAVATFAALRIASNRQGQIEAGLNISGEDFARVMSETNKGPNALSSEDIKEGLDEFYTEEKGITGVEIHKGITPEMEKLVDPLILETFEKRGIDPSSVHIYMCDNIQSVEDEETRNFMSNSFCMTSKENESFIHINKGMVYPSEKIPEAVEHAKYVGIKYPSENENVRRTLNHELTHAIQHRGKFLLTDRAYSIAEKFVLPYLNLDIDFKGIRSTQIRYTSEAYDPQYNVFSDEAQRILGQDKITAEAGRQLATRMEAEAWLMAEAPWLLRRIIGRNTQK